jgi:hypothetical protein
VGVHALIGATREGTTALYRETGWLPGYRPSPALAMVEKDPQLRIFLHILETSKHQRPTMAAQGYYMGALDRAVDNALYNKQTPEQALRQATRDTQRELDLTTAGEAN